jgi:hypothetical protein
MLGSVLVIVFLFLFLFDIRTAAISAPRANWIRHSENDSLQGS